MKSVWHGWIHRIICSNDCLFVDSLRFWSKRRVSFHFVPWLWIRQSTWWLLRAIVAFPAPTPSILSHGPGRIGLELLPDRQFPCTPFPIPWFPCKKPREKSAHCTNDNPLVNQKNPSKTYFVNCVCSNFSLVRISALSLSFCFSEAANVSTRVLARWKSTLAVDSSRFTRSISCKVSWLRFSSFLEKAFDE